MMFMFVLFQISGMTVVPSYTVPMMKVVTGDAIESYMSMLMVDVVRFATAVLACVVVNRFNRRTVLFLGIVISVVSLFLAALLLFLRDMGYISEEYKWTPVVPTLFYIFGKTLGILPIPWAIAGEIFPLAYRSLGSGISGMFLSIMFFVVVKTAPSSFENIGVNGTFFVYGICIAICGVFLYFLLPETKGKTLYEIECHFKGISAEVIKRENTCERERMLELGKVEGGWWAGDCDKELLSALRAGLVGKVDLRNEDNMLIHVLDYSEVRNKNEILIGVFLEIDIDKLIRTNLMSN